MVSISYTSRAANPIQRAIALRPAIEAAAPSIEQSCSLPRELRATLHSAGLFRLLLPRTFNGEEVAPAAFVATVEEIAKGDASTAWCVAQGSGCSMAAAYLEPDVAREIFGSTDAVLAWGPVGPNAKATAVEGGYRVTGTWLYASGSRHAEWLGGHSPLVDAKGERIMGPDGRPAERTMLFRKSAAVVTDVWQVVGLKGTGSDTYTVTDMFIPARYTFTRESPDDRRETGTLYRFTTFQMFGASFAGVALGTARAALDAFMQIASTKVPMLATKPLRENAVVQSQVAVAEAKWQSSRAFLMQTLDQMWQTAARGESFPRSSAQHFGSQRSMPFISPKRSSKPPITWRADRRFSRVRHSSGGFATSTRSRSRCSRSSPISKWPGKCCSVCRARQS